MAGSEINRTQRKRGGTNEGRVESLLFAFFFRQFFDRALLSERLEQAIYKAVYGERSGNVNYPTIDCL